MGSSAQSAKRLQSELMSLMMEPVPGISAFPENDRDILEWKGTIQGPESSFYEGMEFGLSIKFPSDYPLTAPVIKFSTPIFHPNIDMSGNICLDILKEKWMPTYTVATILLSIQGLLETPNNSSPLNGQAAELWDTNKEEFLRLAKMRYANLPIS